MFNALEAHTMQAHAVKFAPASKQEVKALQEYISANKRAIAARKTADYIEAVKSVREIMREHFSINPPQLRNKVCPWKTLGTDNMCKAIAEKYSVPYWDVLAEANPYIS